MDKDKVLLTKSGVEKLEEERDNLINVERPRVIEELQLARSQGDLSETLIMMQLEINKLKSNKELKKLNICFKMQKSFLKNKWI